MTANFGEPNLSISNTQCIMLNFNNLTFIEHQNNVLSYRLSLHCNTGPGSSINILVRRSINEWLPSYTQDVLFNNATDDEVQSEESISNSSSNTDIFTDITGIVFSWQDGSPVYGLQLVADQSSGTPSPDFSSIESDDGNAPRIFARFYGDIIPNGWQEVNN